MKKIKYYGKRKGIRDIWWNAFMVKNCRKWCNGDIPECPTAKVEIPTDLLTWTEAVKIHNKMKKSYKNYKYDAYICFYLDDYKFDGLHGIWNDYHKAIEIIRHFAGIISPDFSTYKDFPIPLKAWNTYRMRTFGFWCATQGNQRTFFRDDWKCRRFFDITHRKNLYIKRSNCRQNHYRF